MIISASYKTDLPAYYGHWFMARLAAGFCRMVNPYGRQVHEVPLDPESVDGFVFWTRNLAPFAPRLPAIRALGYPFFVHYTITGYPRALEFAVPGADHGVTQMATLAAAFGPHAGVWRYDPILLTSLTPSAWHLENFAGLAARLEGSTDEVVISFAHFYRKTRRNLAVAARAFCFDWHDPDDDEKRALVARLTDIAAGRGMRLGVCAQPHLVSPGAGEARCIDAARLSRVADRPISAPRRGNRPGCACDASRDIGDYDSCSQGCVYCYAVSQRALARRRARAHDPAGAHLIAPV